MFPTINIGPVAVQSYGLILLIGLWIGLWLADHFSYQSEINSDLIYNSIGISLVAALLGARLFYVLQNYSAFQYDLLSTLSLNYNLLDPWGAVVAGLLALTIYLQRKQTAVLVYLDAISPLLAVLFLAVPLANLSVGSGFGMPTDLPWSVELWGADRHPTQIYQLIFGSGVLFWLILTIRRGWNYSSGQLFFIFLSISSMGAIFIGAFRADQNLVFDTFRASQIIAWVFLAISLLSLGIFRQQEHPTNKLTHPPEGKSNEQLSRNTNRL